MPSGRPSWASSEFGCASGSARSWLLFHRTHENILVTALTKAYAPATSVMLASIPLNFVLLTMDDPGTGLGRDRLQRDTASMIPWVGTRILVATRSPFRGVRCTGRKRTRGGRTGTGYRVRGGCNGTADLVKTRRDGDADSQGREGMHPGGSSCWVHCVDFTRPAYPRSISRCTSS